MTLKSSQTEIRVSIGKQKLDLWRDGKRVRTFPVSTSKFGLGTEEGSLKTPLGRFKIGEKIGHDQPIGTVFRARVPLGPDDPLPETEDWITSRILWLDGLEPENSNTRERYVYIHGTRHEEKMGTPDSHGCVRMRNSDVIQLFDLVEEGTGVTIEE
jgi:lipoprotein-anchoring transpeptidase ErfK/SrfK